MEESKPFYLSETMQGTLISVLTLIVSISHLNIGNDLITALITGVFGVIGTVMIIYGRIKATKPLSVGGKILK